MDVLPALAGGALIGASASALLLLEGRVAGISGIVSGLATANDASERRWRAWFVAGLLCGGVILALVAPSRIRVPAMPLALVALAGVLVGIGTRLGNGCTSGHGVCGISRGSTRAIVATCTFMITGALATLVVRQLS